MLKGLVMNNHVTEKELRTASSITVELWPYVKGKKLCMSAINDLRLSLNCSRATIFRYVKILKQTGDAQALIPKRRGRKPLSIFLSAKAERILETVVSDHYLTQERMCVEELYKRACAAFQSEGEPMVARSTVINRLNSISPRSVCKKRFGTGKAKEKYDIVRKRYIVDDPLSVMQIDHTPMDVMAVDETSGRVIGRPILTLCIDVASRSICGFQVSMNRPSAMSLMTAFVSAVKPKSELLEELCISTRWPMFGLPSVVHTDNGSDLTSNAFTIGLERWGIKHFKRPLADPKWGGHVERLFRTLNTYIHSLPGTTKSNVVEKGKYKSEKHACLTIQELRKLIASYICNVYHKSLHEGLNDLPINIWDNYWETLNEMPPLPKDIDVFRIHFLPTQTAKIGKYGIRFRKHYFRSRDLQVFRDLGKTSVRFRYNPDDARKILVEGHNGKHIAVPCETPFKSAISFTELDILSDKVKSNSNKWSDADLIRHYSLHDEILASSRKRKKPSSRSTHLQQPVSGALRPSSLSLLRTPSARQEK